MMPSWISQLREFIRDFVRGRPSPCALHCWLSCRRERARRGTGKVEIRILGAPSLLCPLQSCPKVFFSNCLRATPQGWHFLFLIFHFQPSLLILPLYNHSYCSRPKALPSLGCHYEAFEELPQTPNGLPGSRLALLLPSLHHSQRGLSKGQTWSSYSPV